MNKRKTIKIEEFKEFINEKLLLKTIDVSEKTALCFILEYYLHKTNNYNGFRQLDIEHQAVGDKEYYSRVYY